MIWINLVSSTCQDVVNLARGMGMALVQPTLMSKLITNCCTSGKVVCSGTEVLEIGFGSLNLNGSINGTAIPRTLDRLDAQINKLTGALPILPNTQSYVLIHDNKMNGSVVLPPSLQSFRATGNSFSGSLPSIPNSLNLFEVDRNRFTGNITKYAAHFDVADNLLTGALPSTMPNILRFLYVEGNLLSGEVHLSFPSSLQNFRVNVQGKSTNFLSGSLTFQKPVQILLYNNSFSSVVIVDSTSLNQCDLRLNKGIIAPQISNCLTDTNSVLISAVESSTDLEEMSSSAFLEDNSMEYTIQQSTATTLNMPTMEYTIQQSASNLVAKRTRMRYATVSSNEPTVPTSILLTATTTVQTAIPLDSTRIFANLPSIDRSLELDITWLEGLRLAISLVLLLYIVIKLVIRRRAKHRPHKKQFYEDSQDK